MYILKHIIFFVGIIFLIICSCGKDEEKISGPGSHNLRNIKDLLFMKVPAGTFDMGDNEGSEDEIPAHKVNITNFDMSATKISNKQYCDYLNSAINSGIINATINFVTGTKGEFAGFEFIKLFGEFDPNNKCWIIYSDGVFYVEPGKGKWPVVYVSWYGAKAFADYYSLDLPTEAEWEYAARGGHQYEFATDDGTINSTKANYDMDIMYPTDVGIYPPNPYGLYDMSGNVWEWCKDWYDSGYYKVSISDNPQGPEDGEYKVLRGGSWCNAASGLRTANRNCRGPDFMGSGAGFRVIRRYK